MTAYKLRFHPQFVHELDVSIAYYEGHSKTAARKFRSATKKQLNIIKKNPYAMSIRYDDVRFIHIEKFPYSIHYSIDVINNCVLVYRILCDYRDPEVFWKIP